ncbi:MAG: hypothetical protein ACJ76Y_30455 [Thermoanaerobaculia bacterium]
MTFQSGAMLTVCGAFLIAALVFTGMAVLRHPSRQRKRKPLTVEPFTDPLRSAYSPHFDKGLPDGRSFAVLAVRNAGESDLTHLVARCFLEAGREIPCFWSLEPGKRFVPGGSYSADLKRADVRLLIVGEAFFQVMRWARLPADQINVFNSRSEATTGGISLIISRAGEALDIGGEMIITVTFQAAGLDQSERFRATFQKRAVGGDLGLRREIWEPYIIAL